jgi:CBS domain-containing protein
MNIGEMMTRGVHTCGLTESMNVAARLMWENDCGAIVVGDDTGKAVAMITDRDICMAAYLQGRTLDAMRVSSAASDRIVSVRESEGVDAAEALMQEHRIRRIPVVDDSGRPTGMFSMNDLARHGARAKTRQSGLGPESIVRTLAAVCQPTSPARPSM